MVIVSATARIVERASPASLSTSYGDAQQRPRPHVIVEIRDDAGVVGVGEASPLPSFTGETAQTIDLQLREHFLPQLVGSSAFDITATMMRLEPLPGNSSAKAAIDIALHDLQGKLLGTPVVNLLGGMVRNAVPVTYPIGIRPVGEAISDSEQAVDRRIVI